MAGARTRALQTGGGWEKGKPMEYETPLSSGGGKVRDSKPSGSLLRNMNGGRLLAE